MHWQTNRFVLDLHRPYVMGIVNVTPDSFSDGGQHATSHAAMAHCEALLKEGLTYWTLVENPHAQVRLRCPNGMN